MPKKKAVEEESDEPVTPGETLPPLEDFIRKVSGRFQTEIHVEYAAPDAEEE